MHILPSNVLLSSPLTSGPDSQPQDNWGLLILWVSPGHLQSERAHRERGWAFELSGKSLFGPQSVCMLEGLLVVLTLGVTDKETEFKEK